jgi:uncharacterized membrane protein YcgQ (UPF0703/DUF1980 family)
MENQNKDQQGNESENANREFTQSNSNQEFHSGNIQSGQDEGQSKVYNPDRDTSARNTGDEYSNTSTGANYSASSRKEKLTDDNYGFSTEAKSDDMPDNSDNNKETNPE